MPQSSRQLPAPCSSGISISCNENECWATAHCSRYQTSVCGIGFCVSIQLILKVTFMWTRDFCSILGCFSYPLHLWSRRLQTVSGQMLIYLICFHTWREDLASCADKTIITFPMLWLLNISISYPGKIFTSSIMMWQWSKAWIVDICLFHLLRVEKGLYLLICTLGHLYVSLQSAFLQWRWTVLCKQDNHAIRRTTCRWHFRKVEQ